MPKILAVQPRKDACPSWSLGSTSPHQGPKHFSALRSWFALAEVSAFVSSAVTLTHVLSA